MNNLGTVPILALLLASPGQMDREFYQDFRGGKSIHPILNTFGPDPARVIRNERGGLRISLAANRPNTSAVGLAPQFRISGDFEITLGYEILAADPPPSGFGVGVKIWAQIRSDDDQRITLAHVVSPREENAFVAFFSRARSPEGRDCERETLPANSAKGRLRLARTGSELSFRVAEGQSETFHQLQRVTAGTDALSVLRVSATTSDTPCGLVVRLLDLRVRADNLAGAAPPKERSKSRLAAWLFGIAIAAVGAVLLWRYQPWCRKAGAKGKLV